MLDYMWKRGWDEEYSGITYLKDVYDKPVQEYWHDMKFWWPQCEAIIATLLAYQLTGNEKYAGWHRMIHEYAHKTFTMRNTVSGLVTFTGMVEYHRPSKGVIIKGPFHLPRMQWYCWKMLEDKVTFLSDAPVLGG
jgi:N-acylglucosamine 2-epimerase